MTFVASAIQGYPSSPNGFRTPPRSGSGPEEKGYGFISAQEEGKNLFVHYSEIEGSGYRSLEEGERGLYEVAPRDTRGAQAINVRRIE